MSGPEKKWRTFPITRGRSTCERRLLAHSRHLPGSSKCPFRPRFVERLLRRMSQSHRAVIGTNIARPGRRHFKGYRACRPKACFLISQSSNGNPNYRPLRQSAGARLAGAPRTLADLGGADRRPRTSANNRFSFFFHARQHQNMAHMARMVKTCRDGASSR